MIELQLEGDSIAYSFSSKKQWITDLTKNVRFVLLGSAEKSSNSAVFPPAAGEMFLEVHQKDRKEKTIH